jgi:acetyl-CoA acetyltransferase
MTSVRISQRRYRERVTRRGKELVPVSEPEVAIVGIGETPPARRSTADLNTLTMQAIHAALEDAGIAPEEIDGFVTDGVIMPSTVPHSWVASQLGAQVHFSASASYAGAGTIAASGLARDALQRGDAKYVLCYFGVDWGSKPGGPYSFHDIYPAKVAFEKPYGFNSQPLYFSLIANHYRNVYGLRDEHLGAIAVNQRTNSILTGHGQNMRPLDMNEYLASSFIADPLRYPDCCLISDGAAAFIFTTEDRARDLKKAPVFVKGVALAAGENDVEDVFTQKADLATLPGVAQARRIIESESQISLDDIDFAELYDCFTISCLLQIEDLGFCKKGEAGDFVLDGNTTLRGQIPVNTHGGLLSQSYLLAAEHVTEAVRQLRGDAGGVQLNDPELGIVTGLSSPDYSILLLGK